MSAEPAGGRPQGQTSSFSGAPEAQGAGLPEGKPWKGPHPLLAFQRWASSQHLSQDAVSLVWEQEGLPREEGLQGLSREARL